MSSVYRQTRTLCCKATFSSLCAYTLCTRVGECLYPWGNQVNLYCTPSKGNANCLSSAFLKGTVKACLRHQQQAERGEPVPVGQRSILKHLGQLLLKGQCWHPGDCPKTSGNLACPGQAAPRDDILDLVDVEF
ncbi:Uncharacterised protein [Chlamydia abortus]|nr:Uncharacterised protein [Chlamydia abortus]